MNQAPTSANATFCATLCDQWWADGLRAGFVAPGSRSTPLALALLAHPGIAVHVMHDERAASFAALGHAMATGWPAVVLCSSGTAGAHFYAAIIEADLSAVPMIVVTADRPPELWARGAPQTIDQTNLYGTKVRHFVEPGPPDEGDPNSWRYVARELWMRATGPMPGPVHANLSFRDPLTGTPGELPASIPPRDRAAAPPPDATVVSTVGALLTAARGVVIAGRNQSEPNDVLRLAERLGWPVLADHRSGCRNPESALVIRHYDSLLRDPAFADDHRPDVILRIGEIVSSKATSQWLSASAAAGATVISSRPHGRNIDPEAIATLQFDEAGVIGALTRLGVSESRDDDWQSSWAVADELAAKAIDSVVTNADQPNEIAIAQAAIAGVPTGGALVASSSMPIRDIEWFGPHRCDIDVFANRGANGIDGIVATSIGVALAGRPTVCLIGDVAFLHDSTSLIGLRHREVDLTIVVTNNDGGGIFSFLPQHHLLDSDAYETLFGTPHATDLGQLVEAHGLAHAPFTGSVPTPAGVQIVVASTDRAVNLELHERAHQAVADAIAAQRLVMRRHRRSPLP